MEQRLDYRAEPSGRGDAKTVLKLALAWLIVGVPAAWGVTQTFRQSLKLFQSPSPPPLAATQPSPR